MRQYEKAKLVLGELLLLCKTDADFAYVYFYQARGSFNKNEYEKAIKLYEKALSFEALPDKETGTALYQTGFCHEILGEKKNALQYYEKALPLYGNGQVVKNAWNVCRLPETRAEYEVFTPAYHHKKQF